MKPEIISFATQNEPGFLIGIGVSDSKENNNNHENSQLFFSIPEKIEPLFVAEVVPKFSKLLNAFSLRKFSNMTQNLFILNWEESGNHYQKLTQILEVTIQSLEQFRTSSGQKESNF